MTQQAFSLCDYGTSQAMFDPFSVVHFGMGMASRYLTGWDPLRLIQYHQFWEIFENSPWGINLLEPAKFKSVMPCLRHLSLAWDDYAGDSAINSSTDTLMFLLGTQASDAVSNVNTNANTNANISNVNTTTSKKEK